MNRLEKWLIFLIFFIVAGIVGYALSINWYNGMGDNATYADVTLNIAETGKPTSPVLTTIIDYIFDKKLTTITPSDVRILDLTMNQQVINAFNFHFTPIQFLIAPLAKLMPINVLWGNLTALSFVGFLFLSYLLLRSHKVPILQSIVFSIFISLHPAWNYSIFGQSYVDRLFLFTAMLMLLGVSTKMKHRNWLAIFGTLLSILIIEKMAVIVGIFWIAYIVLYWNKEEIIRKKLFIVLGIGSLLAGYWIIAHHLVNTYYSSFLSISSITNFGHYLSTYPLASVNLITFLLISLPLILLALFEWRALGIALITVAPNIFGNLGGAEKVGWATHYHTTYFPFLVWAAIMGFIRIYGKLTRPWQRIGLNVTLVVIGTLYVITNHLTNRPVESIRIGDIAYSSWPIRVEQLIRDATNPGGIYQRQKKLEQFLQQSIPAESTVSTTENLMLLLFQTTKVYYYPLGIDNADYVVLPIKVDPLKTEYYGFYSYLGSNNAQAIDKLLFARLREKGYDVDNPIVSGNVAIIKH